MFKLISNEQEKMKVMNYFYFSTALQMCAVIGTVAAPLTLYSVELGLDSDKIGILGSLMAFCQVLAVISIPVTIYFGSKLVSISALFTRYIFLLIFLIVPFYKDNVTLVFSLLFFSMLMFSIFRSLSEAAFVPWMQEFIPRDVRGRIIGVNGIICTPFALAASYVIKIWLDSRVGLDRFYPVFILAIITGLISALLLIKIQGEKKILNRENDRGYLKNLFSASKDKNFNLFLLSSGTQYLVITVLAIFLTLFFKIRMNIPTGELIFSSTLILIGGTCSGFIVGRITDNYGCRGIRVIFQTLQILLLLILPFINSETPHLSYIIGIIFFLFGFLMWGSESIGYIFMLNYVPSNNKESFMSLAYSLDGLIAGVTTILAGYLILWLDTNNIIFFGKTLGSYEVLFVICAIMIAVSMNAFILIKEEGAMGVRTFLRQLIFSRRQIL
jgi:MFS family permease